MGIAMQSPESEIVAEANRLKRIKVYRDQNPSGFQNHTKTPGHRATQSIDDIGDGIGDERNDDNKSVRGYAWDAPCRISPYYTNRPSEPEHPPYKAPFGAPTIDDINALATWAVDHHLIHHTQAPKVARQLLEAYRASDSFRFEEDAAPTCLAYARAIYPTPRMRIVAHAVNVTCRENTYLVGTLTHKVLAQIIDLLSRLP